MKRLSLSRLLKSWRRPKTLKLPAGTYRLEPTETGTHRLIRLSDAEAEEAAKKYYYWAHVDEDHPVTAPHGLIRKLAYTTEHQVFYGNGWHRTELHLRIGTHREDGKMVIVPDEEVEHISAFLTDRYATRLRRATEAQAPAEPGKDTDRPAP
jgi:hypothetical protein